jgi:hypothetical protein
MNMEPDPGAEHEERNRFPVAFLAGVIIVFLIVAGVVLLSRTKQSDKSAVAEKLPYGPGERAYAEHIHFKDIQMSAATNFLNQEFTYVTGTISNDGTQTIRQLEVTLEFHDPFNQVVLREPRRLVGPTEQPLASGEMRSFQVTLEHVPAEWDQQYPAIRITGLVVE